jgi:hypothetical protein
MKDFFNNISSQMNDLTQWLHITSLPPKVVSTIHQRAEEKYNYLNNEQDESLSNTLILEYTNKVDQNYNFFSYSKDLLDSVPFPEMISYLLEEEAIKINHDKLIPLKDLIKNNIVSNDTMSTDLSTNNISNKNTAHESIIKKEKSSSKAKTNKIKEKSNFDLNKIVEVLDNNFIGKENKDNKKIKFAVKKKTKHEKDYSISESNIENIGLTLNHDEEEIKNKKSSIPIITKKDSKIEQNLEIDLIKSFQEENDIKPIYEKDRLKQLPNLELRNTSKQEEVKPFINEENINLISQEQLKKEANSITELNVHENNDSQTELTSQNNEETQEKLEIILPNNPQSQLSIKHDTPKDEEPLNEPQINNKENELKTLSPTTVIDKNNLEKNEIFPIENEEDLSIKNNNIEKIKKEVDFSIPSFLLEPEKKVDNIEPIKETLSSELVEENETTEENIELDNKKEISHDKFKEDMKEKRRKLYTQANGLPDIKAKREKFKLYQQQKESMYKQAVLEFLKNNPHIFEKYGKENMSWEDIEKMAVDSSKSSE